MVECYEIQDAIEKLRHILGDKCKVVKPVDVLYILSVLDAIRRCAEEGGGDPAEDAVLYIPQYKSALLKKVARDNIDAVSREEMIEFIIDESDYLAEQLGYELKSNKQNDLTPDGTGTKYPTVDAINNALNNLGADKNFVYEQIAPSEEWTAYHGLNKKVSPIVTDSAGTVIEGQLIVNDGVKVVVRFNFPFTGFLICN